MIRRVSLRWAFGLLTFVAAATVGWGQDAPAAQSANTAGSDESEEAAAGVRSGALFGIEIEGLYEFGLPKQGIYSAPGNTFISGLDGSPNRLSRNIHGYSHVSSVGAGANTVNMTRGVDLPNGATVTSVSCYYYDNTNPAGIGATFRLRRRDREEGTTSSEMAEFSIATGPQMSDQIQTSGDFGIVNPVIHNFAFDYFLFVTWTPSAAGSNLRFYGCEINYTYDYLTN